MDYTCSISNLPSKIEINKFGSPVFEVRSLVMGIFQDIIICVANAPAKGNRLDLRSPRYDPSNFIGRYRHFFEICNPLTLLYTKEEMAKALDIVTRYKKGENFPNMTEEEIWEKQLIFDSTLHPVIEKPIPWFARMAAQCPLNTFFVGAMLIFYKTRGQVVFWQWVNQSFNAAVNQANSSDPSESSIKDRILSYVAAVSCALGVSIILNELATRYGGPLTQRLVPFTSVAFANAFNIPLSRQKELSEGIDLWYDERVVAKSKKIARSAIFSVFVSRVVMAAPHMIFIPIVMTKYHGFFKKNPMLIMPFQIGACGIILLFGTPLGLALFPHKNFISVDQLEPEVQAELKKHKRSPKVVYYNKGL